MYGSPTYLLYRYIYIYIHMHMLHSSCSKSSAPHLAFASARLMALRRLVAVLPTSPQYPPTNVLPLLKYFVLLAVALLCWNDSSVRSRPIQIHILGVFICSSSVIVAGRWQALGRSGPRASNPAHLRLAVGSPNIFSLIGAGQRLSGIGRATTQRLGLAVGSQ